MATRKKAAVPAVVGFTEAQIADILMLTPWTLAIDPGETCGFAMTFDPENDWESGTLKNFYAAQSLPMDKFLDNLDNSHYLEQLRQVVIEEYRIYPDKAMMHSGKTLPTAECIGAIKWICTRHAWPWIEQQAAIKEPMAGLLRGRGFKAVGPDRHAKDAELHLWYHALHGRENGR